MFVVNNSDGGTGGGDCAYIFPAGSDDIIRGFAFIIVAVVILIPSSESTHLPWLCNI